MTVHVVGLDGADWRLIRPWIEAGQLPTFEQIVTDGVAGDLQSTVPPVTFPAWKCYSTGKTPGKLGVYEWFAYDQETHTISANDATDFQSREYWDVLAENGSTIGIINMPTTHPVTVYDSVGVFVIAGSPASERNRFTAPTSLKSELLEVVPDYRIKPDLVLNEASSEKLLEEARTLVDQRFKAATWLADEKNCDLVHTTLFITDILQHRLWDQPDSLRSIYTHIDSLLKELLNKPQTDAVVLMSDHGFQGIDTVFLVNQWLLERGDLTVHSSDTRDLLGSIGLTRERLKRVIDRLNLVNFAQSIVPESLQRYLPSESGRLAIQDATIDWTQTKAISLGRGPIYINDDAFTSENARDQFTTELVQSLETLETPTGTPVVSDIYQPTDIYTGELIHSPDLIIEYGPGIDAPETIHGPVFGADTEWLATHRRTGMFAATGEYFADTTADIDIYDLAPTLLHTLGNNVPEDVDGAVRFDLLTGTPTERDVVYGPATAIQNKGQETGDEVESTLRDLGYLE